MEFSARIPLIDETARREAEEAAATGGFRSISVDDDVRNEIDFSGARSLFHQYARDGNVNGMRTILNRFPQVLNSTDRDELTALHYAARYGRVEAVQFLLNKDDCDANVSNDENLTPLHITAKYCKTEASVSTAREEKRERLKLSSRSLPEGGKYEADEAPVKIIVKLLIKKSGSTDPKTIYGMTPLHYAAMKDNLPAAEALVEMGAHVNPDVEDQEGEKMVPPLLTACTYGSDSVTQFLLKQGANLALVRPSDKSTAFHIAAFHGKNQTLLSLLHKAGYTRRNFLLQTNAEGNTPLGLSVDGGNPETANLIIQHLGQFKPSGKEEWLLHEAASKGNLEVVKVLVEAGADRHKTDHHRRLPIHLAARNNHAQVVEYLYELDKDSLEKRDEAGLTPLLFASSYREAVDAVKMLVDGCSANLMERDHDGRTVVYIAAKYNSFKSLEYLLEKLKTEAKPVHRTLRITGTGENVEQTPLEIIVNQPDHNQNTPMHIVCSNGYLETCQLLYAHGASVEKLNEDEETPLHLAAARGRTETVRQLLEWDKTLVGSKDEMGNTPLHLAAKWGHDVAAKALLDAGSDKNSRNENNETPLYVAVSAGKADMVRLLVQKGANLEVETENGTVIHEAARRGHEEIIRYLLSLKTYEGKPKIDITKRINGKTALEIAMDSCNTKNVVRALVECPWWEKLMVSNEVISPTGYKKPRETPMRQVLRYFPDVAITVFDQCYKPNYVDGIEYNFTFLDDTYMMRDEKGNLVGSIDPYMDGDQGGKLKAEARIYSTDPDVIYQNHPLKMIAASERMSLLSHPLVLGLIKYKWNSLGRYVYYSALSVYLFFIVLFTIYVTQTPAPFNVFDEKTSTMMDLSNRLEHFNATCTDIQVRDKPALYYIKIIIIVLSVAQMCKEIFQMAHRRMAYLNFDNAFEWFIYVSAVLTVWDFSDCSDTSGLRMTWQWIIAAGCVFACWINLLLMIRKLPRFGIYVVMFFDIFRTFFRFSLIFILFILAFSVSFFVLLQNRPEFSTPMSAVLKTTVMMIGEFEFTAIFHGNAEDHQERLFGHGLAYPIFFIFCIVMTILLMNLLVGLAVGDIMQVQEKAEMRRLSMQVDLVLQIEATMPWVRERTICGRYRTFIIKDLTLWRRMIRLVTKKFGFESSTEEPVEPVKSEEEERMAELRTEQRAQGVQIQNLQANIDVLYEKQCHLENMMKALLKYHKIGYESQDE